MMHVVFRVAIFVDAGYLYSAGSIAIVGSRQRQENIELDQAATLMRLRATAEAQAGHANLLRIYWYDGALYRGISAEQQRLADTNDVKVRLGAVNIAGQQKGVDSLIVTDLIELARNRAISDAVLLSGDEDIRVGVQIAQNFGVRVHLIGIEPSRGNQSRLLMQEVDTKTEWSRADISKMLSLKPGFEVASESTASDGPSEAPIPEAEVLDRAVDDFVASLTDEETASISQSDLTSFIPSEFDGRLLRNGGDMLGRWLDQSEIHYIRNRFRERMRSDRQT